MKLNVKKAGKLYALTVLVLAITATLAFTAAQDKAKKLAEIQISIPSVTDGGIALGDGITFANERVTGVKDERNAADGEMSETVEPETKRAKPFVLPLSNGVLKDYSEGEPVYSKTMGDWRAHTGADFSGEENEEVRAINDGTVVSVRDDALWGTVVEIDHYDGMTAKYCGLNGDDAVREGAVVEAGEKIGTLSKIPVESGDGIHLHLEIILDGVYVSPLDVLKLD